jgi:integrase
VLPEWGKWKAEDVQKRHVIALVGAKAVDTPIAANSLHSVVRALFGWAVGQDILQHNPAFKVKPPAETRERDRWLSEQEIRQFWERLETARMEPQCRAALRLILITAQRSGEVLSAERTKLDTTGAACWLIPAAKAKNGLQHDVPLSAFAIEEVNRTDWPGRWLIPSPYTTRDAHITVSALANAVAANLDHFGLARFTPHDLRRTAATHMAKIKVPRFIIGKVLNHVEPGVTRVYDRHAYYEEKKDALAKWDRELRRILGIAQKAQVVEIAG